MGIHALSAHELLEQLASGKLSSEQVVEALIARRREVDGRVNAFVHVRESALTEARAADQARKEGRALGPLHGLPITIKDNIDVVDTDSTLGLRARRGHPARRDSVLVGALRRAGVIVLGKTNIPQLLLAQETENDVFGVTRNPWDTGRTCGGSSGGEAAAVAAGMSPLGIGTDIGGSIRIPAHFCGVVGFKPTLDRWSNRGSHTSIRGQELVRAQIGALARSTADVAMLWRVLDPREQALEDPAVPPLEPGDPGRIGLSGLRVGIMRGDAFLEPTRSICLAVDRAAEVLKAAGANVVTHYPTPSEDIVYLWLGAISADGGRSIDRALAGEALIPQLRPSRQALRLPAVVRRGLAKVMTGRGEARVARLLEVLGEKRVDEVWALTARRTDLRAAELDAWTAADIDVLICPPHVVPALPHRSSGDFALSLGAQFRWTLLNFPAGIVPVRVVAREDVGRYPKSADRIERKVDAIDRESVGLPVGVQVVARPYREDILLAVMEAIEAGVRGDASYPQTPISPGSHG